jgi:hypothetical protein
MLPSFYLACGSKGKNRLPSLIKWDTSGFFLFVSTSFSGFSYRSGESWNVLTGSLNAGDDMFIS